MAVICSQSSSTITTVSFKVSAPREETPRTPIGSHSLLPPQTPAATVGSLSVDLPVWTFHTNRLLGLVASGDWLLSVGILLAGAPMLQPVRAPPSLEQLNRLPRCVHTPAVATGAAPPLSCCEPPGHDFERTFGFVSPRIAQTRGNCVAF